MHDMNTPIKLIYHHFLDTRLNNHVTFTAIEACFVLFKFVFVSHCAANTVYEDAIYFRKVRIIQTTFEYKVI